MTEIPKYEPTVEYSPGDPWTIVRFMLMQHKRVLVPLMSDYHFFFSESLMGYLLVQGEPKKLKQYLLDFCIPATVIFDTFTMKPVIIPDVKAQRYKVAVDDPYNDIKILSHSLEYYAGNRNRLVCVCGPLIGLTGYVVRFHRSRRFVFSLEGNITCSSSNIKQSAFMTLAEYTALPPSQKNPAIDL